MARRPDPGSFEAWSDDYLGTKSRHDVEGLLAHFAPDIAYEDAVLSRSSTLDQLRVSYEAVFAGLPDDAASRPVWAAGSAATGGVLLFNNDAAFFGAPMQVVAVVELVDGLVVRQRDYWDGRQVPASVLDDVRRRFPPHAPPAAGAAARAHPDAAPLASVADSLWPMDRDRLDARLAPDVRLRDLTAGVELTGRDGVVTWLAAVADLAPYGVGARASALVGGASGGAVEWAASTLCADTVAGGVLAVRDGPAGVAELVWCWDASRLPAEDRGRIVGRMGEGAR